MARSQASVQKRLREARQAEKKKDKAQRRADRDEQSEERAPVDEGEDPDLAGIVAGPQPIPTYDDDEDDDGRDK